MAIPTSRTKEKAEIRIDEEKCTGCGLCVTVCKDFSLTIENGKATVSKFPVFGCIACGHCMAICNEGAIEIHGRTLSPKDLFELPSKEEASDFPQLLALLQRRRSVREFRDREIEPAVIDKILSAALTAPMGLPPSDVNILIFDTIQKNRAFAKDFGEYLEGMKWLASNWFLTIMKPFWGKANDEMLRGFVKPMIEMFSQGANNGTNYLTYDAPLAIYFYGSPYTDPADPLIAATYAMLAAESLDLGTCMIGSVHPMIQSGAKARKFRKKHGIKYASREGLFVIFGYSSVKYKKGIKRTFASVETVA
jgi:ferredoxin